MIKLNSYKNRSLLIIIAILIPLSLSSFISIPLMENYLNILNYSEDNDNEFHPKDLKSQDLTYDNIYSGIGSPWNVTHWANRTDHNLAISFTNDSYDIASIPLGTGWEGYKLNANIDELSDTRNWCNGSFNYGDDNGYQDTGNDTTYISNKFQNWTFGKFDWYNDSDMAGNYIDSTSNNPETDFSSDPTGKSFR